jgi:hypothetical protein
MTNQVANGDLKAAPAPNRLESQPAKITAQITVRDKDGKVKYEGPLVMDVVQDNTKER